MAMMEARRRSSSSSTVYGDLPSFSVVVVVISFLMSFLHSTVHSFVVVSPSYHTPSSSSSSSLSSPPSHSWSTTSSRTTISSTRTATTKLHAALTLQQIQLRIDCYEATVPKPLGVIFGENSEPYLGLVVDDISEGMNGGKAGLRAGDQLVAVNGNVLLGSDFETAMSKMTAEDVGPVLDLVFYRGPVRQMYTILGNQLEDGQTIASDDEDDIDSDDDGDSEVVVMDESYESPVQIDVSKYEDKPLTAGDFVKAIGKLGSMLTESSNDDDSTGGESSADEAELKQKKKTGFFGIGGESIQLDGDDAKGYK